MKQLQRLDGPRLDPLSGTAKKLVIILHGYGADGADLIPLGQQWQQMLPDTAFVAPNAPQSCENPPMGYQWFPLRFTVNGIESTPQERLQGAMDTAPVIDKFIDEELTRFGLKPKDLALVGFSQGAMMALHVGLRRADQIAGIVSYSGMILGHEQLVGQSVKPPVFLAHGTVDEVVPFVAMEHTKKALEQLDIDITPYVEQGIGHGIDGEATWLAGQFLAEKLS